MCNEASRCSYSCIVLKWVLSGGDRNGPSTSLHSLPSISPARTAMTPCEDVYVHMHSFHAPSFCSPVRSISLRQCCLTHFDNDRNWSVSREIRYPHELRRMKLTQIVPSISPPPATATTEENRGEDRKMFETRGSEDMESDPPRGRPCNRVRGSDVWCEEYSMHDAALYMRSVKCPPCQGHPTPCCKLQCCERVMSVPLCFECNLLSIFSLFFA